MRPSGVKARTALVALLAGACLVGPGAAAGHSTAVSTRAGSGGPSYTDNDTAAQRHAETVDYAKLILRERPVLDGEATFTGTVPTKLRSPNEFPAASNRLVRARYVTIQQSPHRVYELLKAATVAKSRLGGYGDVGAGGNGQRSAFVRFDRQVLPRTMVDGELLIEIRGRPHQRTLLAEFAQVVPHPAWLKAERIPAGSATGTIVRTKYSRHDKVLARHVIKLRREAAVNLATAFDNSWVAAPWLCTGGGVVFGPQLSYRVRLRSHGHTWTVLTPAGCGVSSVTRGRHNYLPGINASSEFMHLVNRDSRPAS